MSTSARRPPRLFSLEVRHRYMRDDDPGSTVRLVLVEPPPARLSELGLMFRSTPGATEAWGPPHGWDHQEVVDLVFAIESSDPDFAGYTELGGSDPSTTLWFDTPAATPADTLGVSQLQRGPVVSAADRAARGALPVLRAVMQHVSAGCLGFIRVRLGPTEPLADRWVITFGARHTIWEYLLVGDIAGPLRIRDRDGKIPFGAAVATTAPDGTPVLAIRSEALIPLQPLSPVTFELVHADTGGERALMKRLPHASPSTFHIETVDGSEVVVSQIRVDL